MRERVANIHSYILTNIHVCYSGKIDQRKLKYSKIGNKQEIWDINIKNMN